MQSLLKEGKIFVVMEDFFYQIDDKEYKVVVSKKRIKNIHYRFINGEIRVSCPILTPKYVIVKGIKRNEDWYRKQIERVEDKEGPIGENYIYFYGIKVYVTFPGKIEFTSDKAITFSSKEEMMEKVKKDYLDYVSRTTKYYASLMGVPEYRVSIKDVKRRYGSNSRKTKRIYYSTELLHYSYDIINSVIVHELAHCLVYNHSPAFYEVVYKYSPHYNECRKKLINKVYK